MMDTKSLAKSKRAHSQHHSKKHHTNQVSKAPPAGSVGAASTKKPPGKQIKEKSNQPQASSALPSNWDRYEEEYDLGLENQSQDNVSQPTDVIVPKSKGADYAYLVSEAKSQFQTNSSEHFPSFDDVFSDFNQGVGSLLSVKGKSILSWIGDNNFVVEDKTTASHEASFLSLDLNALAEQLAKVDLSQRLFIEADLLPSELCIGELRGKTKHEADQNEATPSNTITTAATASHPVPNFTNIRSQSMNQGKDDPQLFGRSGQSAMVDPLSEFNMKSVANTMKEPSRFEASAAEAELDMLLNSFDETALLDSPGFTSNCSKEGTSATLLKNISSNQLGPTLPVKKGPDLFKSVLGGGLDDTIDDLLNEVSKLKNQHNSLAPHEEKAAAPVDVKAKLLDDFDSWLDTI